ncbi:MAG: 16S rRNA (cytidine(1402)-2'-O)-methyltransferase [Bacteroidota bacterium]
MPQITLVPTPIGNLDDITLRALKVLKEADCIAAEDTRTSGRLLKHFEISTPQLALHQHNEHQKVPALVTRVLQEDLHLAVVTDAGTPAISDPGFLLVREAIAQDVPIQTLPGPVAFIPALVNSGMPCDRFTFEGFLPHKKGRQTRLKLLQDESRTMIFYESPHRLLKTLGQFAEWMGEDRQVSVSRELTKIHEETVRGALQEVIHYFQTHTLKGEIVLILEGKR